MSEMNFGQFDKFNITFRRKEVFNDGILSAGCNSRFCILSIIILGCNT